MIKVYCENCKYFSTKYCWKVVEKKITPIRIEKIVVGYNFTKRNENNYCRDYKKQSWLGRIFGGME